MKRWLLAAAFWLALAATAAAQQTLPPNTVWGRIGAGQSGPAEAIPFATLFEQLFTDRRLQVFNPPIYYIDPNNGNDSNSGLSPSSAWQHIQTCINYIQNNLDFRNGLSSLATCQLKYGTTASPVIYNESLLVAGPLVGTEDFTVEGNPNDVGAAEILAPANSHGLQVLDGGATVTINGVRFDTTTSGFSGIVVARGGAQVDARNLGCGSLASGYCANVQGGGNFNLLGPVTIYGNSIATITGTGSGAAILVDPTTWTYATAVTQSYNVSADLGASVVVQAAITFVNSGNYTGAQYFASDCANVATGGVTFPGTSPAIGACNGSLLAGNNLSDVGSVSTARHNLGLGTSDGAQFGALGIGGSAQTTGGFVYNAPVNPTGNGVGSWGATNGNGLYLMGQGTSNDLVLANKSGAATCLIPTGTQNWTCDAVINAVTGFQINSAAPSGHYPRGNGTDYVDGTIQGGDLPWNSAVLQATPGNPTGTSSTTGVMMGLGGSCKISTNFSTRVRVTFSADIANDTTSDGSQAQIRYGTGTAPTNGAALTGTAIGSAPRRSGLSGTQVTPWSSSVVITGLTVGTTYWLDLGLNSIAGGTSTLNNIECSANEI